MRIRPTPVRLAGLARLASLALLVSWLPTPAEARAPRPGDRPTAVRSEKSVAGGTHWRIGSKNGPIHTMYGRKAAFDDFIHSGKRAEHHKPVIVASDTAEQSREFAKKFRYAVIRDKVPESSDALSKREKRAKLLYIRSQYGHSAIANGGKVLPLILRITPLRRL
jgi:hypothetical protein